MEQLIDKFGRKIDYIRISVTDRCNFRCVYCMPQQGIKWQPMENILTYEDIAFFMEAASELGISKVKLTGGEPLARKYPDNLVFMLKQIKGINEISLTTNGSALDYYAEKLKKAGIDRITVSLDTLDRKNFKAVTRLGNIDDVLRGFDALDKCGFKKTKINTVVMRGINDKEIVPLVDFALERGYDIRFIEFMPTNVIEHWRRYFVGIDEIKEIIKEKYDIEKSSKKTNGPSVYYKVKDGYVGFITPLSKAFCAVCNRIRLSSDGFIVPCLGHSLKIDLKDAIKERDKNTIKKLIKYSVHVKPKEHSMLSESIHSSMSAIGG